MVQFYIYIYFKYLQTQRNLLFPFKKAATIYDVLSILESFYEAIEKKMTNDLNNIFLLRFRIFHKNSKHE